MPRCQSSEREQVDQCRLIVHADDFGLSEAINEGIVHAFRHGILTSTSIVASGDAFDHAIGLYRDVPELDLGVHLTLVEERPLLPYRSVKSLLADNGCFMGHATTFMRHYLRGKIDFEQARSELDAQIYKVLDHGVQISHVDSHQHLHALPALHRIVVDLAKKYRIPAIRRIYERPRPYMLKEIKAWPRIGQLFFLNALGRLCSTEGLAAPDELLGFFYSGRLTQDKVGTLLHYLPKTGMCELICHPGFGDESSKYAHWRYSHQEELNALCHGELSSLLARHHVELISYRDLPRANQQK